MRSRVPLQLERARLETIGQRQACTCLVQFPAGGLVFDRPIVFLELGVPFRPRLLLPAVFVETQDGRAHALRRRLSRLRIELAREVILFRKDRAIPVQVVGFHAALVHPLAHTLIPDELRGTDSVVERGVLTRSALELEL